MQDSAAPESLPSPLRPAARLPARLGRGAQLTLAVFVVLLAAAIRLPSLGLKPLMHDESLFAYYSHSVQTGALMTYDPLLHGPFLQEVNALTFSLLGDSDATARLFCALCGVAICVLVCWLKPLPEGANHAAALFAAVSPTLCYYSRFCRNDIPFSFFAVLWLVGCARYWRARNAAWGVIAILAFTMLMCIKENVVFLMATAAAFLPLLVGVDLAASLANPPPATGAPRAVVRARLCPAGLFLTVNNIILLACITLWLALLATTGFKPASPLAVFAVLVALAACCAWALATLIDAARTGAGAEGLTRRIAMRLWRDRQLLGMAAALSLVLFLLIYNYWQIGAIRPLALLRLILDWLNPWRSPDADGAAWLSAPLSDGAAGTLGAAGVVHKAVSYWWGQHAEHRLRGPFHYYVPILAVYEWPLLLVAAAGFAVSLMRSAARLVALALAVTAAAVLASVAYAALDPGALDARLHMQSFAHLLAALIVAALAAVLTVAELLARRRMRAFLIFWFFSTLMALSYAGEKVPWLAVHVALPLALLAGADAGAFVQWAWRRLAARDAGSSVGRRAMASLALGAAVPAALVLGVKWSRDTGRLLANGADARERMVYNHTTIEAKACAARVRQASARYAAQDCPFILALKGEPAWPMHWYLRGIPYREIGPQESVTSATADVILCDYGDDARWPELPRAYAIQDLPLRVAWVPPPISIGRLFMKDADPAQWPDQLPAAADPSGATAGAKEERDWLWRYWLRREIFPAGGADGEPLRVTRFLCAWRRPPVGALAPGDRME